MSLPGRLLVAGADGTVGRAACRHFEEFGVSVVPAGRRSGRPFDLTAPESWDTLPEVDAALICAGMTRIAACAADPAASLRVNVRGTIDLAWHLAGRGAFVVFLSSNQVFDGAVPARDRDSVPCPVSVYGRHKAFAEAGMRNVVARGLGAVLRLTKVVTPDLALAQTWRDDLRAGRPVAPFANFPLAPVTLAFVLRTIEGILENRAAGVFHASPADDASYVDLARLVADQVGADPSLIAPADADPEALGFDALPRYSTLDMALEAATFGLAAPPAAHALRAALAA